MMSPGDLLKVAQAYCKATGLSLRGAGDRACGENNGRGLVRLTEGKGITTRTLETAESYFRNHWPQNARWPKDVPGGPISHVPKFTARSTTPKEAPSL
jgi:hypothetical protein